MSSSQSPEHHKVIIIGAGFAGLAAAKTYIAIDPGVDLLVIDGDDGIGGVLILHPWSSSRIYPDLMYEGSTPSANFSDFDMNKELDLEQGTKITGKHVNEFLLKYAQKFDITRRFRPSTEVIKIERSGAQWKILARSKSGSSQTSLSFTCDKLIVATGLTSKPKLPNLDTNKFDGFAFHAVEMARRSQEVTAKQVNHVTIVGGHKSALEAVGTAVHAGKKVEWLLRENVGSGAPWMLPAGPAGKTPPVKPLDTRCFSVLSTSVYHSNRWLDRFFHSGRWALGTWFISWMWKFGTKKVLGNRFSKSENGAKLKPENTSFFWTGPGGATVLQERDKETLRIMDEEDLIRVSRAQITSAAGKTITLSTGETIQTDGIVFCTGWDIAAPTLFSPSLAVEVGVPMSLNALPAAEKEYWTNLDTTEEISLLNRYPRLRNPPAVRKPTYPFTPFRLYRSIVPPTLAARQDNTLIFLGNYATGKLQTTSEINALWGIAYLENLLPPSTLAALSNEKETHEDIALNQAYRTKRYLDGYPVRLTLFESQEFHDLYLSDLGVRSDRKAMRLPGGWRGWFGWKAWRAEWFEAYSVEDYRGLVREFMEEVEVRRGKLGGMGERTPLL